MMMTSVNLRLDLARIERLIVAIENPGIDDIDREDLAWLKARRRFLRALLAVRGQQQGKKIVRLDLWRGGVRARAARMG